MILCVGEILADMIGMKKDGNVIYERKAGGAPFNVACAAKTFGAKTSFVGAVGADLIGEWLIEFVKNRNLDGGRVYLDETRNTTLAFVELDEQGERSFCFYRKNTADYHIPNLSNETVESADIVHIGSLMLSEESGAAFAKNLALKSRELGKLVSFDINFRTDIFRDKNAALKAYGELIELADIVKFSEDEVDIFGESYVKEKLADKLVCITLGKNGSKWLYKGKSGVAPTICVKPVDTTGAGDAFYGGLLAKLDGVSSQNWTDEFLNEAFRFANVCGALNTLAYGAIDGLPSLETVENTLKNA